MKKIRKSLVLFLAVALCLPLCGMSALAQGEPPHTPLVPDTSTSAMSGEAVEIYELLHPDTDFLRILPLGSDVASALPETVFGVYSEFGFVECPVRWDTFALSAGRNTVTGIVTAPEGYVLKNNVGLETTSVPVALYENEDEPVVFFDAPNRSISPYEGTIIIPKNSDIPPVPPYETLDLLSAEGDWIRVPAQWDWAALDTGVLGRHTVYTTPILPPGAGLSQPDIRVAQHIYVMEEDRVDLGGYSISGQTVFCSWFTTIDPDHAILEISEDKSHWYDAREVLEEDDVSIRDTYLSFNVGSLETGKEYFFRLVYDGRYDGIINLLATDDSVLPPEWEGDRDGGDAGGSGPDSGDTGQKPPLPDNGLENGLGSGNVSEGDEDNDDAPPPPHAVTPPPTITPPPPATVQPTLLPQSAPSSVESSVPVFAPPPSETEGFVEQFSETRDLISGTRLMMMVEDTGAARFSKQGVTVTFSAQAIKALAIQDETQVEVTIKKESENRIFFSLSLDGIPVERLSDTSIMVPYQMQTPGSALSLCDEQGAAVAKGNYDTTLAVAGFTLDATGGFVISEEVLEEVAVAVTLEQPQRAQILRLATMALLTIFLLILGGGILLKRRRH